MLLYVRSDLACDRKVKLECKEIESIFTEINFNDKKWLICGVYRPRSMKDDKFIEDFTNTSDKASLNYEDFTRSQICGTATKNTSHLSTVFFTTKRFVRTESCG
jgi:hypothetical protein